MINVAAYFSIFFFLIVQFEMKEEKKIDTSDNKF